MNRILEATWQAQGYDGKNVVNGYLHVFKEPLDERAVLVDVYTGETLTNPLRIDSLGQVRDFFVDGDSKQTYWIRLEDDNGNELYTKHYITALNGIAGTGTLKNYTAGDFIELKKKDERTEQINVKPAKQLVVESPLSFLETADSLTLRLLGQFATSQELAAERSERTYSEAQINARIDSLPVVQQFWNQIGNTLTPKDSNTVKAPMFSTDEYGNASNWFWAYQFALKNDKSLYITYGENEYRYDPTREIHINIEKAVVNNGETEIKSNGHVLGVIYANQGDDNEIDIGETLPEHTSTLDIGKVLTVNSDNEVEWGEAKGGAEIKHSAYPNTKDVKSILFSDGLAGTHNMILTNADDTTKSYTLIDNNMPTGFLFFQGAGMLLSRMPTDPGIHGVTSDGLFEKVPTYSEGYGIKVDNNVISNTMHEETFSTNVLWSTLSNSGIVNIPIGSSPWKIELKNTGSATWANLRIEEYLKYMGSDAETNKLNENGAHYIQESWLTNSDGTTHQTHHQNLIGGTEQWTGNNWYTTHICNPAISRYLIRCQLNTGYLNNDWIDAYFEWWLIGSRDATYTAGTACYIRVWGTYHYA